MTYPYRAVLLDIEGTVCSISFVHDKLFPYALAVMPAFIRENWDAEFFRPYRDAFPAEAQESPEALEGYIRNATAKDLKIACLKSLQGLLWETGYKSGDIKSPVYPDVLPAIKQWIAAGVRVIIYSSGSVAAQKLLFAHTDGEETDITKYLEGYYDTVNAGPKQEAQSYKKIAESEGLEPKEWLFLSDNLKEIDAAKQAGMDAIILVRPGNAPLPEQAKDKHRVIHDFDELAGQPKP